MLVFAVVFVLAIAAASDAQTKRYDVCVFTSPDCSGTPSCQGNFIRTSCALSGVLGLGVRATCGPDGKVFLYENTDCSGAVASADSFKGQCSTIELQGKTYSVRNTCTVGGIPPTAAPATVAPTTPAPATPPPATPTPAPATSTAAPATPTPAPATPTPAPATPTPAPATPATPAPATPTPEIVDETPAPTEAKTPPPAVDPTSAATVAPKPTATPSEAESDDSDEDDDNEDGSVCFDATSTILLADGSRKMLSEVMVGDRVESVDNCGRRTFEEVFLMQHAGVSKAVNMVELVFDHGSVRVTPTHYIRIPGVTEKYIPAGDLSPGDTIYISGENGMIEKNVVDTIARRGAPRNVHTMNDRIVVDGVVASCVSANPVLGLDTMELRLLLAPLKALHRLGFSRVVNVVDQAIYKAYNSIGSVSGSK